MLDFLRQEGKTTDRKLRLFAVACCRSVWHLLENDRSENAVEIAERYADKCAGGQELETASHEALSVAGQDGRPSNVTASSIARHAAVCAAWTPIDTPAGNAAIASADAIARVVWFAEWAKHPDVWGAPWYKADKATTTAVEAKTDAARSVERAKQCGLIRDIFGNPFRVPPAIQRAWLAWNNGTVAKLATIIYEERSLPSGTLDPSRLGVLADALFESGCHDEEVLAHLREPGLVHVRGCFALDLLLQRE